MQTPENSVGTSPQADVEDLINAKYEELRDARLMKMSLEEKLATPQVHSKLEEMSAEYQHLLNVIPQLEREFEDMKAARANNLEERFGNAANTETYIQEGGIDQNKIEQNRDAYEKKFGTA